MALEEDRISSLPDCLLVEILSRLADTKYAIRTSTLCKRWQHLWLQLSNLFLTYETVCNIPQFYSSLERFLKSQTHVNKFKLHAFYNTQTQVNNCIRNAIRSHNVQEVDLHMTCYGPGAEFVLPDFFFTCSSFIHVSLFRCKFERANVISWENLKTLHISNAFLEEDMIENILSGSPLLETLKLDWCYGFKRFDITTNKSVKNLEFFGYLDLGSNKIIQINAPYILSLAIEGHLILNDLMMLNVSSLINAELNYSKTRFFRRVNIHEHDMNEMLNRHLLNLAHAKEFKIGKLCLEVLGEIASG